MRVVVTGGTGNVGTAVVHELVSAPEVESVLAVSRRRPTRWPETENDAVTWARADVAEDDLAPVLAGADVVIHLAWLFQPMRRPSVTWRANVLGTRRVMEAAAAAGVGGLVVASSVGAYSPRRSLEPVDESYPTDGVQTAPYSREKAYVERMLDAYELSHPGIRVVRMRPGFILQVRSATQQRRLFVGPLVPERLLTRLRSPVIPDTGGPEGLHMQTLHTRDAGRAYRLAATRDVRGAFNIAADPVVDMDLLAEAYGARKVPVPYQPLRGLVDAAWTAHLLPAAPGMFDLLASIPLMSTRRAREELGWTPEVSSLDAIRAVLEGMRGGADGPTPPLARETGGRLRGHEFGTGVGSQP